MERERSRASTGMVDLFDYKSPYKKRTTEARLSTPFARTNSGQKKPEPLRARNRGEIQRDPPKEVKFSKYSPLPAIKTRPRPKLLRERTYDVIEPVYVKGPLPEDKVKLPEIKKPLRRENSTPTPVPIRAASRGAQLTTPKRNKTLAPEQSPVKRTKKAFNPSNIAPQGEIPSNVFWFPM